MSTSLGTVTIRPVSGPDEIPPFDRLPYALNHTARHLFPLPAR
ncbi:hypothetical protein ACWD69_10475 [Micromonospora chokoriensis]